MPSTKPHVQVRMSQENRDKLTALAREQGYKSDAEFVRSLLKSAFDRNGTVWDESDPVKWGGDRQK